MSKSQTNQRIGQHLGNYRLVHLLGQGGFAQIYLGEHLRLGTQVAIKVLSAPLMGEDMAKLFVEARTIARLEHPHIVRLLDFDVEEDTPFLVMSYAPHGTLRQRYPKGSALPPDIILIYLRQAAAALQYAHDEKVIHRDIKPENLLLGRRDELLLSDFGIAVLAHTSRSLPTQEIAGTMAYMAPEQLEGKPRPASDQYALAVIVYEWLCGMQPFKGTSMEIMAQHLHVSPPPLHEKLPTLSPGVEDVVLKALSKDPKQRFASIQEFASAFEQAYLDSPSTPVPRSQQASSLFLPSSLGDRAFGHSAPTLLAPGHPPLAKRVFSRRALLIGLPILTGLVGAGAAITWQFASSQRSFVGRTLVIYNGHSASVRAVAWSPDSERIASAGDLSDTTVQLWDATTGAHPFIYRGYPTNIASVAWSPDGKELAIGGGNSFFGGVHTVQIWNATSGKLSRSYAGHAAPVHAVAWSPDGASIASAGEDKTVQVWEAASGKQIQAYTGHSGTVNALAWSPNGTRIVSASDDASAQVWEPYTAERFLFLAHRSSVYTVAWSSDGNHLATGSGNFFFEKSEHLAQVWKATTGERLLAYHGHSTALTSLSWSPNATRIVSASSDKTVQVWDASTGVTIFSYRGHTLGVNAVAWSPNEYLIASASLDGTVHVWQAP